MRTFQEGIEEETKKMKRLAAVLVVACFCGSSALGGMISFSPGEVTIDREVDDPVFTLDLTIASSVLDLIDSADMIVGSDDLAITNWVFADFTRFFESSEPNTEFYSSGWKFGFFGPPTSPTDFLLGTLTVDTTGVADGDYTVVIDAARDNERSSGAFGTDTDGMFGTAIVHIIPEPTTLSLLGLAALGLIRRRRKSA